MTEGGCGTASGGRRKSPPCGELGGPFVVLVVLSPDQAVGMASSDSGTQLRWRGGKVREGRRLPRRQRQCHLGGSAGELREDVFRCARGQADGPGMPVGVVASVEDPLVVGGVRQVLERDAAVRRAPGCPGRVACLVNLLREAVRAGWRPPAVPRWRHSPARRGRTTRGSRRSRLRARCVRRPARYTRRASRRCPFDAWPRDRTRPGR